MPPDPPRGSGVRRILLTFFTPDLFACLLLARGFSTFAQHCIHVTFSLGAECTPKGLILESPLALSLEPSAETLIPSSEMLKYSP